MTTAAASSDPHEANRARLRWHPRTAAEIEACAMPPIADGLVHGWMTFGGTIYANEGYPVGMGRFALDNANCAALLISNTADDQPVKPNRDPRLTYNDRGDIAVDVVWSLKPGQPTIVAICTDAAISERYRPFVVEHHKGHFHVEKVLLDHAFGRRDVQSAVYKAAERTEK